MYSTKDLQLLIVKMKLNCLNMLWGKKNKNRGTNGCFRHDLPHPKQFVNAFSYTTLAICTWYTVFVVHLWAIRWGCDNINRWTLVHGYFMPWGPCEFFSYATADLGNDERETQCVIRRPFSREQVAIQWKTTFMGMEMNIIFFSKQHKM